jgi:hypothetical protein
MRLRRLALLAILAGLVAATPARAARPLRIGFGDGLFTTGGAAAWMPIARSAGADVVRLPTGWGPLAPTRPAAPTDPADPAYRWSSLDDAVRTAAANGLSALVSLTGAPPWAEGSGRPSSASPGAWRPDSVAYGRFARALARRYDGTYPDPSAPGRALPKVDAFQPWNEPNLATYLAPQWVKRGGAFVAESAAIYRDLQNAFTAGVRATNRQATVVTAGTAPFGDPQPGGRRIMPVRFWRSVLCVSKSLKRVKGCGATRFDALSHHPYSVGGPLRKSLNGDDVSLPDMGKLSRVLRAAERLGSAPGRHRLWVTEVSWDSKPDDPDGVPERTQATWLAQSLMVLWRQGVDTITWFQIQDQSGPDFAATVQSGTYRANGRSKTSAQAFGFPLAIERKTAKTARVWLRAPQAGQAVLQVRRGGRWKTVTRVTVTRHGVAEITVLRSGATAVRATVGGRTSLAATLR